MEDKIKELDRLQAELRKTNVDTEEDIIKYNRVKELMAEIYDITRI